MLKDYFKVENIFIILIQFILWRDCSLISKKASILFILTIFLVSSFHSVAHSYRSDFLQDFDEELVSNIEFYCYSNSSVSMDEKSLLMLKQVKQNEMFSSFNIASYISEDKQCNYQEIVNAENENMNDIVSSDSKDSPWPMKCHDNHHTGRSPYNSIDNNGIELWKFKTNSPIDSGSVIDEDGTIYFGSMDSYIYALNPNGNLKWKFKTGETILSTPAINQDGTILIGSYDGFLYSLYPNGALNWKIEIGSTSSSPAIGPDGTIYIGTLGNKIKAVNPDGLEKWSYQTGFKITSDPAVGLDGTIYIGSGDTYLYALNPNGTLNWRYKTNHYVKGPPSIADDGTIYIGSYDNYLYALNQDGTLKWKIIVGLGTETNPSISIDGTIYVGGDKLYAINPNGTIKWNFNFGSNRYIHQSSPAISSEGCIYIGTNIEGGAGGEIVAIYSNGTEKWRHKISDNWVDSSPSISFNGTVYIGSSTGFNDGYLYAFGHGDENNPPDSPSIDGLANGKSGESYTYVFTGSDPDGDTISYFIDWGDGSDSDWQGSYESGDSIELSHSWSEQGYYTIKAKVKDEYCSESSWSTLEVIMPKQKVSNNIWILFYWLKETFSIDFFPKIFRA